ncbi:MAG TPA: hypothetical protein PKD12_01875 [Nitrospira sp.]|nr:hypothetical protein [Nitrospira sp.]
MNKIVTVLGFIIIASYTNLDLSWGHSHQPALSDEAIELLHTTQPVDFIGPVVNRDGLLQRAEEPSWDWFNLVHTDPHHAFRDAPYRPAFSQHFYAPDGAAVMFGWTFGTP